VPPGVTPPADYVIGPEDVLAILFWRDKDMSAEVAVRPDGRITLPLINDIVAAGLTPDELRERVQQAASRYVESPNATVVVKQINSRRVFVTGKVAKPGTYPLMGPTTVLQMIAMAGGLMDFAKSDRIVVMRTTRGKTDTFKFNYKDVSKSKNLQQNIELKPGDTILVP
jgi:polysaccharide export outer membrane protein